MPSPPSMSLRGRQLIPLDPEDAAVLMDLEIWSRTIQSGHSAFTVDQLVNFHRHQLLFSVYMDHKYAGCVAGQRRAYYSKPDFSTMTIELVEVD